MRRAILGVLLLLTTACSAQMNEATVQAIVNNVVATAVAAIPPTPTAVTFPPSPTPLTLPPTPTPISVNAIATAIAGMAATGGLPTASPTQAPTPTPAASVIATFSGSGRTNTGTFSVNLSPWILEWETFGTQVANMVIYLGDPATGSTAYLAVNDIVSKPTKQSPLIYGQIGTFYLDVVGPTASSGGWKIRILRP